GGWTIVPALKTLAQLFEEDGKGDEAGKGYQELADLPGVPKELVNDSTGLVAKMLLRNGKHADAEKRLTKLDQSLPKGDPQRPFVQVYLAEAKVAQNKASGLEKELEEVIKSSEDPRLRGLAYNMLGDLYRTTGRLEDAFWAYMRVEAQYHEDPEQ